MNNKPAQIYLIPCTIAPNTQESVISPQIKQVISAVDYFLVENVRTARRFISSLKLRVVSELHFEVFNKHTDEQEINKLLSPLRNGQSIGVISEAGCPAIADPGNQIVQWAHRNKVKVTPLVGPSSLILALMASGMNGQHFEFHGYLPIDKILRLKKIQSIENESLITGKTQIFMETPYRNRALAEALLDSCANQTNICFACNLSSSTEEVRTKKVSEWRGQLPDLHKIPTIFLLHA